LQPIAARRSGIFNKMHGALRALHVSLNNASIIYENCPQIIENEKWPPNNSPNGIHIM